MAIQFLNEVWATRLLMDLEAESVFKERGNQNYQADASNAKQVHIGRMTTDITVSDYAKNGDMADPQLLDTEETILQLDNQKAFSFYVDDIDKVQTKPMFMTEAMRKSAIAISQKIDDTVIEALKRGGATGNNITMAIAANASIATAGKALIGALIDLKAAMRLQNIANSAKTWVVLTPKYLSILEKYFLLAGTANTGFIPGTTEQVLRSGFMGNLLGIDIFCSNRAPTRGAGTKPNETIIGGTNDAFTYADNVTNIETYRPEKRFGDAVKGLYVYGVKVTEPKQLFSITNA